MVKTYLTNAISPNMLPIPCILHVEYVTNEIAKKVLSNGFINAIGHAGTASLISKLLQMNIQPNRINIKVDYEDQILVFALQKRIEEGKVLSEDEIKEIGYNWCLITVKHSYDK
jgi:Domain of unknown function (DUF1874).